MKKLKLKRALHQFFLSFMIMWGSLYSVYLLSDTPSILYMIMVFVMAWSGWDLSGFILNHIQGFTWYVVVWEIHEKHYYMLPDATFFPLLVDNIALYDIDTALSRMAQLKAAYPDCEYKIQRVI